MQHFVLLIWASAGGVTAVPGPQSSARRALPASSTAGAKPTASFSLLPARRARRGGRCGHQAHGRTPQQDHGHNN